jgi:hypothetical protein
MNSKQSEAVAQAILGFVRGEVPWEEVGKFGILVKEIENGYDIKNPEQFVAIVRPRDVGQGLLHYQNDLKKLRSWAGLIMAGSSFIELDGEFEGTSEGELLLQALWDAWFGQEVKSEAISAAARLSGYS